MRHGRPNCWSYLFAFTLIGRLKSIRIHGTSSRQGAAGSRQQTELPNDRTLEPSNCRSAGLSNSFGSSVESLEILSLLSEGPPGSMHRTELPDTRPIEPSNTFESQLGPLRRLSGPLVLRECRRDCLDPPHGFRVVDFLATTGAPIVPQTLDHVAPPFVVSRPVASDRPNGGAPARWTGSDVKCSQHHRHHTALLEEMRK